MTEKAASRKPVVTGLSPRDGIPGTQIVIRGENLGVNERDLIGLWICGTDCLMSARWESSSKIVARVGPAKGGAGDVLVTTKSGGRGSGTVRFRVYTIQIGQLTESAVWVDETRTVPGREVAAAAASAHLDGDPLGISDEHDERKRLPDVALAELFPDGSGNRRLKNFVPAWYLLETHQKAAFADLRGGLVHMQRQAKSLPDGPKKLLKSNLTSFLSCVDSLAALHKQLNEQKRASGWPLTRSLEEKITSSRAVADKLFSDVLGRKDRADSARNALSILTRFRFVFFLPQSIETNLEKKDYAVVMNEYARAKSLFGESEVSLFKEAFAEIEKKMDVFKASLKARLVEMPTSLDEQKKIIRYLLMVEPESDPGWDSISAHHHWLEAELWDAQRHWWTASKMTKNKGDESSDQDDKLVTEVEHRFEFVDSVLSVLSSKLHPFWKLVQAYVNGQLSAGQNLHREDEIEQKLVHTVTLAGWLMLNALLPEALAPSVLQLHAENMVVWPIASNDDFGGLLRSLRSVRALLATLYQQEFTDKQLQSLLELCSTLRLTCLQRVLNKCLQGIADLQKKENWKLQSTEAEYSKTHLPDLFETQVTEVLPLLQLILSSNNYQREVDLFAKERFCAIILKQMQQLLEGYRCMTERLVRLPSTAGGGGGKEARARPTDLSVGSTRDSAAPHVKDKRLLIALCNCDYVLRFSVPTLCERIAAHGVPHSDRLLQGARQSYAEVRAALLRAYTAAKCAPFAELLPPTTRRPTAPPLVSNGVRDLLLCVVSVHAELFLVGPHFTQQVVSFVIRACAQQLAEHTRRAARDDLLDSLGATQAAMDSQAFEEAAKSYLTPETRRLLTSSRAELASIVDNELLTQGLRDFQQRMRLTLLSLHNLAIHSETADV